MLAIVKVPGALEKAGKNARRLAEMYYSREILADKLENVLLAAVQRI
ncbi:MAG: hypothetical protein QNJ17_16830 [Desulfocapsaceae bacterium]|nr:hypothetical protein [Desulfocapsaceae bacterium]